MLVEEDPDEAQTRFPQFLKLQPVNVHAADQRLFPDSSNVDFNGIVEVQSEGNCFLGREVVLGMNPHPTFTEVMDMHQTVLHVASPQDIRRKNPLDRSFSPGQRPPFHSRWFGFGRLTPSRLLWTALFALLSLPSQAFPFVNQDGARVELASHLPKDQEAVVFFHAPWSKTSARYGVELADWEKKQSKTAVLGVQVKNLASPVAKQYNITAVPAFLIYDKTGQLKHSGQAALNEVLKMMSER